MSFAQKDRKIQSQSGINLPDGRSVRISAATIASAIAEALQREFHGTGSAVKTIATLTGANERAVKNWLQARNGPSGESLILLCRHSDHVLETILTLAGRHDLLRAKTFIDAKGKLKEMLALMEELG